MKVDGIDIIDVKELDKANLVIMSEQSLKTNSTADRDIIDKLLHLDIATDNDGREYYSVQIKPTDANAYALYVGLYIDTIKLNIVNVSDKFYEFIIRVWKHIPMGQVNIISYRIDCSYHTLLESAIAFCKQIHIILGEYYDK